MAKAETVARKRKSLGGRPARHAGETLAKNRTFRVRGKLDAKLQESATATGRSVSEEIEFRLERSFYDDAMAARFLGTSLAGELLRLIRGAMAFSAVPGGDWSTEPERAEELRCAVNVLLAVVMERPVNLPPADSDARRAGAVLAMALLARSSVRGKAPGWAQSFMDHALELTEQVLEKVTS